MESKHAFRQGFLWTIIVICIGLMLPVSVIKADGGTLYLPIIDTVKRGEIAFVSDRIIHTMLEDGSNVTALLPNSVGYAPDYSPDGNKIAFEGWNLDVYVMNADGSGVTSLNAAAAIADLIGVGLVEVARPDWSPDGSKIVADAIKAGDYIPDLFVMNQDGTDMRQLTNTPDDQEFEPQWLPNGKHISFWSNCDIYTIGVDGSIPVNVTNNPLGVCDGGAVWSPNGKKIAVSVEHFDWQERSTLWSTVENRRVGSVDPQDGIYVMNADGSDRVQLTAMTDVTVSHPAWSPDGEKIAFTVTFISDPDYSRHLYVMQADGSDIRPLTDVSKPGDHYSPTWRP